MSAEERRQRIAEAQAKDTGVGVRCPRCLVHTPGLKPRKVKVGTTSGPHGGGLAADTGTPMTSEHPVITDNPNVAKSRRESGSTIRQYQCPVCDYAWSAT
jgi:hypothetical protein